MSLIYTQVLLKKKKKIIPKFSYKKPYIYIYILNNIRDTNYFTNFFTNC